jgi:hypothetical protein
MCEEIESFGLQLESIADGESEVAKLLMGKLNMDYHARRFRHYTGHQARLAHEQEAMDKIKDESKVDPSLLFISSRLCDEVLTFERLRGTE